MSKYDIEKINQLLSNINDGTIVKKFGRYTIKYRKSSDSVLVKDSETGDIIIIRKNSLSIEDIPYTQELCDILCSIDDMFYKSIPIQYKSDELTKKMIKKYNHQFYEYYPEKYRDRDMTIEYVKQSGASLYYVPKCQINQELCDMFVLANPACLLDVPRKYIKDEYFDYIISKNYHLGVIPIEYRTFDVCTKFIELDKSNLAFVPDNVLEEMCDVLANFELANLSDDSFWMLSKKRIRNNIQKIKKD